MVRKSGFLKRTRGTSFHICGCWSLLRRDDGSCCDDDDDDVPAAADEVVKSSSKSRDSESLSGVTKCDALGSDDCDVSSTKPPMFLLSLMLA